MLGRRQAAHGAGSMTSAKQSAAAKAGAAAANAAANAGGRGTARQGGGGKEGGGGGGGGGVDELTCKVCGMACASRNQLFKHIQQTGHAAFK